VRDGDFNGFKDFGPGGFFMFREFRPVRLALQGFSHRLQLRECQDSHVAEQHEDFLLLLVADGVGSSKNSKIGSSAISNSLRRVITLGAREFVPLSKSMSARSFSLKFVEWLNVAMKEELLLCKAYLGDDSAAEQALAATLLGVIITKDVTLSFGCGDGVLVVNNRIQKVTSPEENKPDLPIYAVAAGAKERPGGLDGQLRLYQFCSTLEVESIFLGTDGAMEIIQCLVRSDPPVGRSSEQVTEELVSRSLGISASGALPNDDITVVGALRSTAPKAVDQLMTKGSWR
jgi:hypothetical protein